MQAEGGGGAERRQRDLGQRDLVLGRELEAELGSEIGRGDLGPELGLGLGFGLGFGLTLTVSLSPNPSPSPKPDRC